MPTTTDRDAIRLTLPGDIARPMRSDPVMAAGGLRLMARHLAGSIDATTAHPDRLRQVAADVEGLLADATTLAGKDQHDGPLHRRIAHLEQAALDLDTAELWTVQALAAPGTTFDDGGAVRYVVRIAAEDGPDLGNGTGDALHVDRAAATTVADLLNLRAMHLDDGTRYAVHLHRTTPRP